MILDLFSNNEMLVYKYLESQSKHGSIKQSTKQISNFIKDLYEKEIPVRKKRSQETYEQMFSEATVHRAIKKMQDAGLITIVPSQSKTEMNEIIFHGNPDDQEIIEKIKTFSTKIVQSVSRLERVNHALKERIETLEQELQSLYLKHNESLTTNQSLIQNLEKIKKDSVVVKREDIVSTKKENNQIILIVRT
jgi:DNA-binding PadR family transcriptional regulator